MPGVCLHKVPGKGPSWSGKQPELQGAPLTLARSVREPMCLSLGVIIGEPGNLEFQACSSVTPVGSSAAAAAKPPQKWACSFLQRNGFTYRAGNSFKSRKSEVSPELSGRSGGRDRLGSAGLLQAPSAHPSRVPSEEAPRVTCTCHYSRAACGCIREWRPWLGRPGHMQEEGAA